MREIWKQIKGFEGLYSVSNYGNVRRDKTHNKAGAGNYAREEHVKSQKINNKGYVQATIASRKDLEKLYKYTTKCDYLTRKWEKVKTFMLP